MGNTILIVEAKILLQKVWNDWIVDFYFNWQIIRPIPLEKDKIQSVKKTRVRIKKHKLNKSVRKMSI